MSSSCVTGATTSGGVTFMRAFSSLIPSTCFIAYEMYAQTYVETSLSDTSPLSSYNPALLS